MGDPVNLASRLESLTKRYGLGLLVGEATMRNVSNVHWLLVDRVRVKGKELPARIYTPVRPWPQDPNTLEYFCSDWQIFQDHYVQGDWPGAVACMQKRNAQTTTMDRLQIEPLIALYAQRLDALKANAPQPGWQGITDFDEK
jgi:adenylate cyclase